MNVLADTVNIPLTAFVVALWAGLSLAAGYALYRVYRFLRRADGEHETDQNERDAP